HGQRHIQGPIAPCATQTARGAGRYDMNEFEWLKQTRALRQPVAPRTDLWTGIAARIETPAAAKAARRPRLLPWAMAASVAAISLLAGALVWHQPPVSTPRVATHAAPAAITPWQPRDPRL